MRFRDAVQSDWNYSLSDLYLKTNTIWPFYHFTIRSTTSYLSFFSGVSPNCSACSTVSRRMWPRVSGIQIYSRPATVAKMPNTRDGSGFQIDAWNNEQPLVVITDAEYLFFVRLWLQLPTTGLENLRLQTSTPALKNLGPDFQKILRLSQDFPKIFLSLS